MAKLKLYWPLICLAVGVVASVLLEPLVANQSRIMKSLLAFGLPAVGLAIGVILAGKLPPIRPSIRRLVANRGECFYEQLKEEAANYESPHRQDLERT